MSGSQRAPPLHGATSLGRRRQWWLWGEQNSNYSSVAHSPSSTLIQSQDGGVEGDDAREGEKEEDIKKQPGQTEKKNPVLTEHDPRPHTHTHPHPLHYSTVCLWTRLSLSAHPPPNPPQPTLLMKPQSSIVNNDVSR